jgi:hypothetical protein
MSIKDKVITNTTMGNLMMQQFFFVEQLVGQQVSQFIESK